MFVILSFTMTSKVKAGVREGGSGIGLVIGRFSSLVQIRCESVNPKLRARTLRSKKPCPFNKGLMVLTHGLPCISSLWLKFRIQTLDYYGHPGVIVGICGYNRG